MQTSSCFTASLSWKLVIQSIFFSFFFFFVIAAAVVIHICYKQLLWFYTFSSLSVISKTEQRTIMDASPNTHFIFCLISLRLFPLTHDHHWISSVRLVLHVTFSNVPFYCWPFDSYKFFLLPLVPNYYTVVCVFLDNVIVYRNDHYVSRVIDNKYRSLYIP